MAATFAVSVLMVSAGVSASGAGDYGHAVQHDFVAVLARASDLSVTKASISTTTPPRMGNSRLEVAAAMVGYLSDGANGRSETRYTTVRSASLPAACSRLCWNAAVSQLTAQGSRVQCLRPVGLVGELDRRQYRSPARQAMKRHRLDGTTAHQCDRLAFDGLTHHARQFLQQPCRGVQLLGGEAGQSHVAVLQ